MFFFRVLAHVFGWLLLLVLAFLLSALVHLDTGVGHRAVRVLANDLITDLIAGRLEIRHVERVRIDRIVVSDVSLYDRHGIRVIHGERIVLVPDVIAGLEGVLRFSHTELHRGTLRLEETLDGDLTFIDALSARRPNPNPTPGGGLHAYVEDMHLDDLVAYGNMLGARNLHARDVHVLMRMEFTEEMDIQIFRANGIIDGPMDFEAKLDNAVARISGDPYVGSTVDARVHYGDQRVRAHLTYALPRGLPEDAASHLDLYLHANPIDVDTIHRIGFDWAAPFQGRGEGYVRLYGPPQQLRLAASLEHEAGPIVLNGQLPSGDDVIIEARTPGLDLSRLVPNVPALPIGGNVRLVVHPDSTGAPTTVHANLDAFVFDGYAIPTLEVDTTLLEEQVRIDSIRAPYGGTDGLRGSGYATYEGDYHVELAGSLGEMARDPNVQRFAPGARGRSHVRATVDSHGDVLTVDASGRVEAASVSGVSASSLSFRMNAETVAARTRLSVRTEATDLRVGPMMLGDGEANLRSSGDGYAVDGSFFDPRLDGRIQASSGLSFRGEANVLTSPSLHYERRGVSVDLVARRLEYTPHHNFITEGGVLSLNGERVATLDARWAARGQDAAQVVVSGLPLDTLTRLVSPTLPPLDGLLRMSATLSGDLETSPVIDARGTLDSVDIRTLRDVSGDMSLRLERGQIAGRLSLDGGDAGQANIDLTGTAAVNLQNFDTAIREGNYDFHGELAGVDIGRVAAGLLGLADSGVHGCLDGRMDFGGYLAYAPTYDAQLAVSSLQIGDSPPFELDLLSRYDGQNLEASAAVGAAVDGSPTSRGAGTCRAQAGARVAEGSQFATTGLAEGYVNLTVPLLQLFDDPELLANLLQVVPWQLSFRVPPRRIGTLPTLWREQFPAELEDFQLAASVSALGGFGPVQASGDATLDYVGDTNRFVCGRGSYPRFSAHALHANGETRAELSTYVGRNRVMSSVARLDLPLDEWLAAGTMGPLPATHIDAAITTADVATLGDDVPPPIETSEIPFLCEYFRGPLAGTLGIVDLFTDDPLVYGSIQSTELQFRRLERSSRGTVRSAVDETPVIPNIALKFSGDSERLSFNHDMVWWDEDNVTQLQGFVDWTWNAENPVPTIAPDAQFAVHLDAPYERREGDDASEAPADGRMASTLPMQVLTGWIPLFGQVEGSVRAQLDAAGTLDAPRFSGDVTLEEGVLTLAGIGQRLRGVNGRLTFDDERAVIERLSVRDENGTASVRGELTLEQWNPRDFAIELEAEDFPVRNEGSIMARLTGNATMRGELEDEGMVAEVAVQDLNVAMAPISSQDPIQLADHPDVRIVGIATGPSRAEEPYPMRIHLLQTPRFWVRSDAFAAQVSTDLHVNYEDPDVRIAGTLEIHRGFFDVMGKRFDVTQGSMAFDGGTTLDPQVSLVATHQLRGGGRNDTVTVRASGTLTAPNIEFTSPLVSTGDQGQILCILVTGSASGQCGESGSTAATSSTAADAGDQAASFLTGVAFGVATLALREQFGDFIPMLSVESGRTVNSARIRAGFNFDQYIPESLRGVVRGIYIEGYVNAGSTQGAPAAASSGASSTTANSPFGFKIELQFPRNIMTQGEYAPPSNWRLGVTWEP